MGGKSPWQSRVYILISRLCLNVAVGDAGTRDYSPVAQNFLCLLSALLTEFIIIVIIITTVITP